MVKRIFKLLEKKVHGLHEAAYVLGVFALLSQFLALIRDRILANQFGAGEILDIYYAAFRIPDFLFVSIASLVSLSVLIPFFTERLARSKEDAQRFVSSIFGFFSILMIGVSVLAFIFSPKLLAVLFPAFVGTDSFPDLLLVTRILLLQPILLGLSSLFASVVHVYQKFILYAASPLLYNAGIIIGIVVFYPIWGISGLAWGVVLGALLHLGLQLPYIIRSGFFPRHIQYRFGDISKVMLLSLPRTIALSANQISLIFLISFASLLTAGSISIFSFSFNLQSVPLAIIGASYSVAAFPTLTRLFSNGERDTFFSHISVAARHIIFWSVPAMVFFIVLRAQIVRVILGSGEFTWTDTRLTAAALALFAVSLIAQSLVLLFVRGYYAAGKTTKPLIINVVSAVLVVVFSFIFLKLFEISELWRFFVESLLRVEGISGTEILMLPLGYSLAVFINALLFWILFQKDFQRFSESLSRTFFESLAASVIMGFAIHQFLDIFDDIFDLDTFLGIFAQGFLAGSIGILVGILVLRLLGNKELLEVWQSLTHKFWKINIISSE